MDNSRFRFRAWDKELKFMVDPTRYFVEMDGSVWFNLGENEDDLIEQTFKLELMQYTGLKDKNGKEFYIGDIYKRWSDDEPEVAEDILSIGYERGECFLIEDQFEIIGNIYENPELLEEKE